MIGKKAVSVDILSASLPRSMANKITAARNWQSNHLFQGFLSLSESYYCENTQRQKKSSACLALSCSIGPQSGYAQNNFRCWKHLEEFREKISCKGSRVGRRKGDYVQNTEKVLLCIEIKNLKLSRFKHTVWNTQKSTWILEVFKARLNWDLSNLV